MAYKPFINGSSTIGQMLTNHNRDITKADLLKRIENLRQLFKSFHHREREENEKLDDDALNKKRQQKNDYLNRTEFEEVEVRKRPAISINRKKTTLRWKKSKSRSESKKNESDVELSLMDIYNHRDFRNARKMMSEVKKRKIIDRLLNAQESEVVRKLFETDMAQITNVEIKMLHRAFNNLWEELMCNITDFQFERESIVFLCEREKVKARFLDVMLLYPHFIPDTWGGRHFCELVHSMDGAINVHHNEIFPSPITQSAGNNNKIKGEKVFGQDVDIDDVMLAVDDDEKDMAEAIKRKRKKSKSLTKENAAKALKHTQTEEKDLHENIENEKRTKETEKIKEQEKKKDVKQENDKESQKKSSPADGNAEKKPKIMELSDKEKDALIDLYKWDLAVTQEVNDFDEKSENSSRKLIRHQEKTQDSLSQDETMECTTEQNADEHERKQKIDNEINEQVDRIRNGGKDEENKNVQLKEILKNELNDKEKVVYEEKPAEQNQQEGRKEVKEKIEARTPPLQSDKRQIVEKDATVENKIEVVKNKRIGIQAAERITDEKRWSGKEVENKTEEVKQSEVNKKPSKEISDQCKEKKEVKIKDDNKEKKQDQSPIKDKEKKAEYKSLATKDERRKKSTVKDEGRVKRRSSKSSSKEKLGKTKDEKESNVAKQSEESKTKEKDNKPEKQKSSESKKKDRGGHTVRKRAKTLRVTGNRGQTG
ncbi:hypothetical protein DICVIV_04145 [Dictyocaulus viviparus]|uniref:DUF7774 domain-containing protein n=1 Tax=Dictyocaulus viviparus TaxID=29172 RepID=A0A0D8Y116_DICVI|nr:hypothetical protein DICVIV_04145 [Dictyocaulus viviparus]